jgi:hypothetical protein
VAWYVENAADGGALLWENLPGSFFRMTLSVGAHLGPHETVGSLGAGGMVFPTRESADERDEARGRSALIRGDRSQIVIVQNWLEELKRRVPVN